MEAGILTVAGAAAMAAIAGAVLTEENAAFGLLAMMLLSSLLALLAAFSVLWVDRSETRTAGLL